MKRSIEVSEDGSTTLRVLDWDEPYHSRHGAIQESRHVFLDQGLRPCNGTNIHILEMGFGTGLNALLTYIHAKQQGLKIRYLGLEAFPLQEAEWAAMNYLKELSAEALLPIWRLMHTAEANAWINLNPHFEFCRAEMDVREFTADAEFDLVYFDAFGPRVQPELWTSGVFENMYRALRSGGTLVTYCSKGSVRRDMQDVGFRVEKIPGPPGKREMLRAQK